MFSELASPNPTDPNRGRSPATAGRLVSLAGGDLVYIRNEGDGKEELYNERDDPRELSDRSRLPGSAPSLSRFRDQLRRLEGGTGKPEGE